MAEKWLVYIKNSKLDKKETRSGYGPQLLEYKSSKHEGHCDSQNCTELSAVVHTYNPSPWEVEAEE